MLSCLHLTLCRRHGLILIIDKSDSIFLIGIVAGAQGTNIARAGNKTLDHGVSLGAVSRQRAPRLAIDHFSSLPHSARARRAILVWFVFSDCTNVATSESYTALERLDAKAMRGSRVWKALSTEIPAGSLGALRLGSL